MDADCCELIAGTVADEGANAGGVFVWFADMAEHALMARFNEGVVNDGAAGLPVGGNIALLAPVTLSVTFILLIFCFICLSLSC